MSKYGKIIPDRIDHPVIALVLCTTGTYGEQWNSVECFPAGDIETPLHEMAMENASSFGSDWLEEDDCENPDVGAQAYRWQFTKSYAHVNGGHGEDEVYKYLLELNIIKVVNNFIKVDQKALEKACYFPPDKACYFPQDTRLLDYLRFEQVCRHESKQFEHAIFLYE